MPMAWGLFLCCKYAWNLQTSKQIAYYLLSIQKSGDIEDAPGLDALHSYSVVVPTNTSEKIKVTADQSIVESKQGRNPCSNRKKVARDTKPDEQVVIVGGGSGSAGTIEGLREVSVFLYQFMH